MRTLVGYQPDVARWTRCPPRCAAACQPASQPVASSRGSQHIVPLSVAGCNIFLFAARRARVCVVHDFMWCGSARSLAGAPTPGGDVLVPAASGPTPGGLALCPEAGHQVARSRA